MAYLPFHPLAFRAFVHWCIEPAVEDQVGTVGTAEFPIFPVSHSHR